MPNAPLVLAFDTSAAHCAAALMSGDTVLASQQEDMAKGQAERLMVLCQEVMDKAGCAFADLDLLGVGIGPGNFTGIRISVAAARGLALGLGVPAIGVSILEAQAFGYSGSVVSSVDARRGTFYVQSFGSLDAQGPTICDLDTLPPIAPGIRPACVGHRAGDIAARLNGQAHAPKIPVAEAIARIAQVQRDTTTRPAPLYLRPADAAPARDAPPTVLP